ncbi:MAG: enoyl-CoA hydratase-related protein [Actinomycetes bacterium]
MAEELRYRHTFSKGVLAIELRQLERLNAVNGRTLAQIAGLIESRPPTTKAIIIRGAGRAFCSGADLSEPVVDAAEADEKFDGASRLILAMTHVDVPVVIGLNGAAAGVGAAVAMAGDVIVARAGAYLLMSFVRIGLMPDGGATMTLAASVGRARALDILLTGQKLDAERALEYGLVASVVPEEAFDRALDDEVARAIQDRDHLRRVKRAINALTLGSSPERLLDEQRGQAGLLDSSDFATGVAAFGQRTKPEFTGGAGGLRRRAFESISEPPGSRSDLAPVVAADAVPTRAVALGNQGTRDAAGS